MNWKVVYLLQSIIRVSEVMYAFDKERCLKLLLQLYNNAWLHQQLCYDLFRPPQCHVTHYLGWKLMQLASMQLNSMSYFAHTQLMQKINNP